MNEAAMYCCQGIRTNEITSEHINKAYLYSFSRRRKRRIEAYILRDKEITAYHEAGHALITKEYPKKIELLR